MFLSEHYSLKELTVYPPEFGTLDGFTNEPSAVAVRNLRKVCAVLERLYERFGKLEVVSGYRSFEYDAVVCGVDEPSNHIYGSCVDVKVSKKLSKVLMSAFLAMPDVKAARECKTGNRRWLHVET